MTWHEKIAQAHLAVTSAVSHNERLKSKRYFVWQEEVPDDFIADNRHCECRMTGTTDLFTPMEFDPWVDQLGKSFDDFGIAWELNSIQYEKDTGVTHYEWVWSV